MAPPTAAARTRTTPMTIIAVELPPAEAVVVGRRALKAFSEA